MTDLQQKLARIGLGAAAIGAVSVGLWPVAGSEFDPEKALAAATAIFLWLGAELFLPDTPAAGPALAEHDRILAQSILSISDEYYLAFLRDHDFGWTWRYDRAEPTYKLQAKLGEVRSEFDDKELQESLLGTRRALSLFAERLAYDTGNLRHTNALFAAVPDIERETDEFSEETVARIEKLNALATDLYSALEEMFRLFRSKGINLISQEQVES